LLSSYHYEYYYAILGGIMLGYTDIDIAVMKDAMDDAIKSGRLSPEIEEGLEKAISFLDGLWAEGYFD
jgi:hypothetical protein